MSIDALTLVMVPLTLISLVGNVVLVIFIRRLMNKFSNTLGAIDAMNAEVDAFIESTEALVDSEVYLLGEEPSVKAVRENARFVLDRLEEVLRNIPSEWQLPEEQVAESANERQER